MEETKFSEIDLELQKEFPEMYGDNSEEPTTDENDEVEVIDLTNEEPEADESTDENNSEEDSNSEVADSANQKSAEPQKEPEPAPQFDTEKANKAFAQLRKEKKEYQETLETLAKLYNYPSVEELKKAVAQAKIKKEAEAKGVDPKFYEEFAKMKQEMEQVREREKALLQKQRAAELKNTWAKVSQQYGLDANDEATLYNRLEADGYTLEDVLGAKNFERLIVGTLSDVIIQKNSKPQKLTVDDGPIKSTAPKTKTIDELIDEEMIEYAKKRGLSL